MLVYALVFFGGFLACAVVSALALYETMRYYRHASGYWFHRWLKTKDGEGRESDE